MAPPRQSIDVLMFDGRWLMLELELFKLHDAVNTGGFVRYFVDEHVGWMHILKGDAVGSMYGLPVWLAPAFALASRLARA